MTGERGGSNGSVTSLEDQLQARADTAKQTWWSNYVKGAAFYGVPMATTRRIGLGWWSSAERTSPLEDALALGLHPITEVRLVGISVLERVLIPDGILRASDLSLLRTALDDGAFNDWNTCDWFCVKVLNQLMDNGTPEAHMALHSWSDSSTLWTKRASLVGFVNLLRQRELSEGFDTRFIASASTVASDRRRFCQTSIGWTMRELSVREPVRVEGFLGDQLSELSREAITSASKKLASPVRRRLLDAHRSAATKTH